jgi:hypothetical protein
MYFTLYQQPSTTEETPTSLNKPSTSVVVESPQNTTKPLVDLPQKPTEPVVESQQKTPEQVNKL